MRKFRTVISLIVLVCFVFSLPGCSGSKSAPLDKLSVDKVKDILEKDLGAKEYDYSRYSKSRALSDDYDYFKDGYYITSSGTEKSGLGISTYSKTGDIMPHHHLEIRRLESALEKSGTGYVMYRTSDKLSDHDGRRSNGNIARSTLMIYAEFSTEKAAMDCFANMTKIYFDRQRDDYERSQQTVQSLFDR